MTVNEYQREPITAYTDGSCLGNPGPGGWGIVVSDSRMKLTACGHDPATTNQRMELQAAIEALKATARTERPVILTTDSQYVSKGVTEWLEGWKARGWRTSGSKPVANADLWRELDTLAAARKGPLEWRWRKGHSGCPGNSEADAMARLGAEGAARRKRTAIGEAV